MKNPKKLTRNVIVLGLVSLCNDASSEMIYPLLPIFLTITLGVSAEMLGLIEGTEKAFIADLVKTNQRGTAYGVFNFAIGIGALPASVFMGILWHRFSPAIAFGFGATLAMMASLLLVFVRSQKTIVQN